MIENPSAVKNVEEILAVEGIDYALFGPADFSMSLACGGAQKSHPEIQEGLKKTIAAAKKLNKGIMLGVGTNKEQINVYREMGVNMFEIGSDIAVLRNTWLKTKNGILEG